MKNILTELVESIPTLMQNTHLNVNLQGWPAAVAVIAVSISGVAIYAIRATHQAVDKQAAEPNLA